MSLLERLGVPTPVIGAGMGGGLSASPLTIAIGRAGGMGQIGIAPAVDMRAHMAAHRDAEGAGPLAVNLLLPFARRAHWESAADADAVVTFWGTPKRNTDRIWIHQCGSLEEAETAVSAGADGVIAQGVQAGGHVRGTTSALELTEQLRAALRPGYPIWTAGGIADRTDVEAALAAGAEAVVVGTRFLMSDESGAHPEYKRRLTQATETVLTELFGAGWAHAPHRVIPNDATRRWLHDDPRGSTASRMLRRVTAPALSLAPLGAAQHVARYQRPWMPLLMPTAPIVGDPDSLNDSAPLYAGECVARITDIRPAHDIVLELAATRA